MEENKITISKFEYNNFVQTKLRYEMFMNYILNGDSTSLSFDGKDLSISASSVIKMAKAIDPIWFNEVLRKYKNEKETEENNDTN